MGHKVVAWIVFIGLLLQTVPGFAQAIDSLSGVILNMRNSLPIEDARIRLEERAEFSAVSDELGNFRLQFDPPLQMGEAVRVRVEKKGFKTLLRILQVSERVVILELTPTEGPNYRKWISLGISLAAAGAAMAFFQAAEDSREKAEASRTESEFEEFNDEFHRNRVFTITFEIVSGAAGGYFLYEQFFRRKPPSEVIAEENKLYFQIRPHQIPEEFLVVFQKRF